MIAKKSSAYPCVLLLALLLAGCKTVDRTSSFANPLPPVALPDRVEPYPDDQVLQVAKARFSEGSFGLAARYYERAVEVAPANGEAWLGLAASYDRVRRFDLADRAYEQAGRYLGNRAEYHNGVGYSYLLRGEPAKAHSHLVKAHELDPANPVINNNLQLLRDALGQTRRG